MTSALVLAPATQRRFWAKVDSAGDCWLWMGAVQSSGYGSVGSGGRTYLAHRVAYTMVNGPIPDGLTINHLCGVKRCVRPEHLEAVTLAENNAHARATGLTPYPVQAAANAAKTHCPAGHPYAGANLYVDIRGDRYCRICKRECDRRSAARRRLAKRNRQRMGDAA